MASSSNQSQQQPINYSTDASTTTSLATTTKTPVNFDEDLFLFVPHLTDIVKCFEKNPSEIKVKLDELRKQFESCHDMITRIEGIDTTINNQRSELERLDNELKSKTELLKKHIQMCKFDLNIPPKSRRIPSETEQSSTNQSVQNAMNINDDDDDDDDDNDDDDGDDDDDDDVDDDDNDDDDDDDDDDDVDFFPADDNTNLQQETNTENFPSFFS